MFWLIVSLLIHFGLASEYVSRHIEKLAILTRHLSFLADSARPLILRVAGLLPKPLEVRLNRYLDILKYHLDHPEDDLQKIKAALEALITSIVLVTNIIRSDRRTLIFSCLFAFRYLRLIVHFFYFGLFYRSAPVPKNPSLRPSDCTVILPTVDPKTLAFDECLTSCLHNKPGAVVIVTSGGKQVQRANRMVEMLKNRFPRTSIAVAPTEETKVRQQIAHALQFVKTNITILLDDHAVWPSHQFLPTVLAPFEDPAVGLVGTKQRIRHTDTGFGMKSFWNMLRALSVEQHNFETRATNTIDGGVSVVSSGTSAHRTKMLKDHDFIKRFLDERFFFRFLGPLDTAGDRFITHWTVKQKCTIKIQCKKDALVEINPRPHPGYLTQCLSDERSKWRSYTAGLFTRTLWSRHPWCLYAVYWTFFLNFTLFYDAALFYTLAMSPFGNGKNLTYLALWILSSNMVGVTGYFFRRPPDLFMLPGYFIFSYFHSLIKLYAGLTFWKTNSAASVRPDDPVEKTIPYTNTKNDSRNRLSNKSEQEFVLSPAPQRRKIYQSIERGFDEKDFGDRHSEGHRVVLLTPAPTPGPSRVLVRAPTPGPSRAPVLASAPPAPAPARAPPRPAPPAPVRAPARAPAKAPAPEQKEPRRRGRPRKSAVATSAQAAEKAMEPRAKVIRVTSVRWTRCTNCGKLHSDQVGPAGCPIDPFGQEFKRSSDSVA